ncbi:lamin tail domain-containing protein [Halosegnis longus]|uniref:lamin tail domain-containing protein n=1 Tax=Halosegnis longus TaxID=2216012 RepID=UPI00096A4D3A|nr:lamin tail domain-containing protein [Salella cibi]
MRRLAVVCLVLLAGCVGMPAVDTAGPTPPANATTTATPALPDTSLTVTVTRVVDGDTLDIEYANGTADTLRLVGVDTPEVYGENDPAEFEGVPETQAGRDCLRQWGERASDRMGRLDGETVRIAFDENLDTRGYYDRLLVYVVHDGSNVNYGLVANGYARVYDSDFSRGDEFYAAESQAMTRGTGLWTCASDEGATDAASDGPLAIEAHADAAGNDNENLNDEYVDFTNTGDDPLVLDGWTVADAANHEYTFERLTLASGATVRLHTGSGTDREGHRYWGASGAIWNNGGDTVTVTAENGTVVAETSY